MKDIPIIFSAPMVLGLLREAKEQGTGKSMTRRLAWRDVMIDADDLYSAMPSAAVLRKAAGPTVVPTPWQRVEVGDRLWVRENFFAYGRWISGKKAGKVSYNFLKVMKPGDDLIFAADFENGNPLPMGKFGSYDPAWHLRPNIFLERQHSRLTLIVTGTKVERLQDISESDAKAEGIEFRDCFGTWNPDGSMRCGGADNAREAFRCLWINLHGTGTWEENPEVVAISFRPVLANVDAIKEAA